VTVPAFLSVAAGFTEGLLRPRFVRLAASRCGISWAAGWWITDPISNLYSTNQRPAGAATSQSI
jgi:hypothetical protein